MAKDRSGGTDRPPKRVAAYVVAIGAALGVAAGVGLGSAWADGGADIDNMVPTQNLSHACNEGSVNGADPCRTDNATLTFYMDSADPYKLEAADKTVVRNMLSSQYSPTHLNPSEHDSPVLSGDAETDIIYQEGSVPGDDEGYTWCDDNSPAPEFVCDQQYIRIEGAGDYTPGLSCHETGHAVGLTHGYDAYPRVGNQTAALGCMKKSVGFSENLGANQITSINAVY